MVNLDTVLTILPPKNAMADNESHIPGSEYQHQCLPDPSDYIRLLTAKHNDGDDPCTLECELTTWHIDESPAFSAISYSWGDPAQTALVRVNGRPMTVTQNCEIALLQASSCAPGQFNRGTPNKGQQYYYWCDAVCIDQRNQAEKEAQVAAMGRVYRRAEHVLACLGPPVEGTDSTFLFRKLRSRLGQLRRIGEHWLPQGEFQVDVARLTDAKWTRMVTLFLLSMPRCSVIRLCRALESVLGGPYFQRTWVCQELFLGRSVSVCCGSDSVPISAIYGLAQVSTFLSSSWSIKLVDLVWRLFNPCTSNKQLHQHNSGRTRYFLWLLGAGSFPNPMTRSLGSLMWKIRDQECGDARDKVYGTLSMVRWPDDEAISVDYCRDTFDLAIRAMAIIKKRPGGWDGRWYDLAANVSQNLRLGHQPSEQLTREIRSRECGTNSPPGIGTGLLSPQVLPNAEEAQQHDFYWGYRLVRNLKGGEWEFEGLFATFSGLAEGRTTRIRTWKAESRPQVCNARARDPQLDEVFLPPMAQPGDWCLMHSQGRLVFQLDSQVTVLSRRLRIDRVTLIAREVCQDQQLPLRIIGKGLVNSDMAFTELAHPIAAEFKVYLADDDALALAASSSMTEGYGHYRPMTPPGVGERASEDEASCYFHTSVCASPYSSYALRLKQRSGI